MALFSRTFRNGLLLGSAIAIAVAAAAITYERYDTQTLKRTVKRGGTLVIPPGCDEIAVVQATCRFFIPMRPGDTGHTELRMKNCSQRKKTKLGEGYFITTERLLYNQRNEPVRSQEFTVFHYHV